MLQAFASGEIHEYMERAKTRSQRNDKLSDSERRNATSESAALWHAGVKSYLARWVDEHKDCRPDTWTAAKFNPSQIETK